ncbi:hypothetical protein [Clostridium sp.]|uniref:hypothetical protein n=1 Tax=Clostridium sp. TaxID=1506 RepID=UPI003F4B10A9
MNINKAIRKQRKTYKRFVLSMCFIFVLLPLILKISKIINIFLVMYLICIEIMITLVLLLRFNEEFMEFKLDGYKISIWCGIAKMKFIIICNKVAVVHTMNRGVDLQIIIITKSRFRNKRISPIDIKFLQKYPCAAQMYNKIKVLDPEQEYFYITISNGGFRKYNLLDNIYKSCVGALFSDDAIEKIKEYREYSINPHGYK